MYSIFGGLTVVAPVGHLIIEFSITFNSLGLLLNQWHKMLSFFQGSPCVIIMLIYNLSNDYRISLRSSNSLSKQLHITENTKFSLFIQSPYTYVTFTYVTANTVNTYLLCEILKILIGNMLNSMKESPSFYPFSCVSHLEWNGDLTFLSASSPHE